MVRLRNNLLPQLNTCREKSCELAFAQFPARCAVVQWDLHPPKEPGMKRILTAALIVLAMAAADASEPTEKDAIAMVEKGAAYIKQHGKDKIGRASCRERVL